MTEDKGKKGERPLVEKRLFINKTIKDLDTQACNVLGVIFTDGTRIDLEVEALGGGIYGIVSCICSRGV